MYENVFAFRVSDNVEWNSSPLPNKGNILFLPDLHHMRRANEEVPVVTIYKNSFPLFDIDECEIEQLYKNEQIS